MVREEGEEDPEPAAAGSMEAARLLPVLPVQNLKDVARQLAAGLRDLPVSPDGT